MGWSLKVTVDSVRNSPTRVWFGYQVLCGLGIGAGFQIPVLVVQTVWTQEWVPVGTAAAQFFQAFGGAIAIAIAQTLFQNGFTVGVTANAPDVDPMQFINGEGLDKVLHELQRYRDNNGTLAETGGVASAARPRSVADSLVSGKFEAGVTGNAPPPELPFPRPTSLKSQQQHHALSTSTASIRREQHRGAQSQSPTLRRNMDTAARRRQDLPGEDGRRARARGAGDTGAAGTSHVGPSCRAAGRCECRDSRAEWR